jgi:hypothetical protein
VFLVVTSRISGTSPRPGVDQGLQIGLALMAARLAPARMRHNGCGGRAGKVEPLTGVDGASSRPVRKILLRAE